MIDIIAIMAAITRCLQLAANMILLGGCVFFAIAGSERAARGNPWLSRLERALPWLAVTLLLGLLGLLATTTAQVTGVAASVWRPEAWWGLIQDTRVGYIWTWRAALALVVFGIVLFVRISPKVRWRYVLCATVAALTLAAGSLASHSAADELSFRSVVPHALHIVLAGVWFGALPAFLAVSFDATGKPSREQKYRSGIQTLKRFSGMALSVMIAVVATGLIVADRMVDTRYAALVATSYGWLLNAKLALLVVILAIAARAHFTWLPSLGQNPELAATGGQGVRKWLAVEFGLATALVVVAAMLANAVPAKHAAIDHWPYAFRFSIAATWDMGMMSMGKMSMGKPGMDMPGMDMPGMHKPGMDMPGMHKPAMGKPAMDKPGMHKPAMDMPAMDKPGMDMMSMVMMSVKIRVWVGVVLLVLAGGAVALGRARRWKGGLRRIGIPAALAACALAVALPPLAIEAYPETYRRTPIPFDARSIAKGKALFAANCVPCHGHQGKGNGVLAKTLPIQPVDLLTEPHTTMHTAGDFFHWLTYGGRIGGIMPAFGDRLSEEARWDILNFLHANFRGYQARIITPRVVPDKPYMAPQNFSYAAHDGSSGTLKEFRYKQAVLLVLFSWPESRARLDQLRLAYAGIRDGNTVVLAVPMNDLSPRDRAEITADMPFPVVTEGAPEIASSYALFRRTISNPDLLGEGSSPTHMEFLIDRYGYLRARWIPDRDGAGWTDLAALTRQIAQLSREKEILPPPDDRVR